MPDNKPSAKSTCPVTIATMYERVARAMDGLLDGSMTPEKANAMANNAQAAAAFAKIELQAMHIALSHDRQMSGSGFMPALDDTSDAESSTLPRVKILSGRNR